MKKKIIILLKVLTYVVLLSIGIFLCVSLYKYRLSDEVLNALGESWKWYTTLDGIIDVIMAPLMLCIAGPIIITALIFSRFDQNDKQQKN